MFSSTRKASIAALKGLSPVFERRNASGRYIYRVGLFNSYSDVLSKLNAVKKAGFRSAFITAYIDGKEVSVSKARSEENRKQEEQVFYRIVLVPEDGSLDATLSDGIRQQADGKDIAKSETDDGRTAYVIGPFADQNKAESLLEFIKAMGVAEVSCEPIVNDLSNQ